jgi:diguanylate cyclase (GGDEF)-like protein
MNGIVISVVVVPGIVALLLFFVFTYLYEQSRQLYFRAWQLGWAAYTIHYLLDAWGVYRSRSEVVSFFASLMLMAMAFSIYASTRLIGKRASADKRDRFHPEWFDIAIGIAGAIVAFADADAHMVDGAFHAEFIPQPYFRVEVACAVLLLYSSVYFYRHGRRKNSVAYSILSISLAFWAVLMAFGQVHGPYLDMFGVAGGLLGPVPQMLLGIAMVMVLFENERNAVQENALAFSTLGVDAARLLSAADLSPSMQATLDRLIAQLPARQAMICFSGRWRPLLPSVQRGFSDNLLRNMESSGAGEYVSELAYRRGGFVTFHNVAEMSEPLPAFPGGRFEQFRQVLVEEQITNLTAVSLQTREHHFGVIVFPHAERRIFGSSNLRLLIGLALQIGLTLENYVVMHDAQRRTKEYELLTQIGQAISSRLDQDEIFRTIHQELGQIFDTTELYIAFQEGDQIRFELEVDGDNVPPKRTRPMTNGLTEYIVRTGQPLLIRADLERVRERLSVTFVPDKPAKSLCGVPIMLGGRPAGVIVALSTRREYAFEDRDLELMQTAAGQISVAMENARLFAGEQRRSRHLAFLNNISKTAISSEDSEQMLADIVADIQKNFRYDHIGVGILDYATKDIEIKAEAGTTAKSLGRRIALGTGIVGRVARTGETALVQATAPGGHIQGVIDGARAVLCIPISYGDTLMGVLNVESLEENAFAPQDVLIMNTLADLLATALHNSFVFQKLQQQSITDGLTGIKTRRFFLEALSSEWKRASRSGRPFSVVLIDLDKFKEVNDSLGHLEGDLVLARVGRLLEQKCRQSNIVARYGGDEFIILMPETSAEQAQILAERLRLWLASDPMLTEHHITGSFGVASFPVHGFSAESIIRVADAGMYVSKHAGGDRVSAADEYAEDETGVVQRQLISAYIEKFLQRDHVGLEHLEDLTATLRKLSGGDECNQNVLRESIESLTHSAELREVNGAGHGELSARYSEVIARALGLPANEVAELAYAARVHDVGKIFVSERVLNKSGPLSNEEFEQMQTHATVGAEIAAIIPNSEQLRKSIEHHHESFDGSGYPAGLRGDTIPMWARIIAVADAYVNLTAHHSAVGTRTSDQALAELGNMSGTKYDGMLVRILARELKPEKVSINAQSGHSS